jgi:integrase
MARATSGRKWWQELTRVEGLASCCWQSLGPLLGREHVRNHTPDRRSALVHLFGKRKWKKIGTDKREAQKVVNKINARIALGEFSIEPESSQTTIETALGEWFDDYRPTFSVSFAQIAKINIDRHLVPFFGSMDIRKVEERHLLQFITEKTTHAEKPLRASTLRMILSVLRRVIAIAVERGDLARNPCQRMDRLLKKVEQQQAQQVNHIDAWTRAEVATLLDVARSSEPRFYPLMTFLLSTGCRRGEALGLK